MIKNKSGFTLIEFVIAILIFSFMMISLATIYATSNRHMFQSYRENVIKSNMNITMKTIQNALSKATRIDEPAPGASGNELKFATNVDNNTACYPLVPGQSVEWHYFCLDSTNKKFYHYNKTFLTASQTSSMSPCPSSGLTWNTGTYSGTCTGDDNLLLKDAVTDASVMGTNENVLFSRKSSPSQTEADQVRIVLRIDWQPPKYDDIDLSKAARPVQVTFDTTIKPNITGQTP